MNKVHYTTLTLSSLQQWARMTSHAILSKKAT